MRKEESFRPRYRMDVNWSSLKVRVLFAVNLAVMCAFQFHLDDTMSLNLNDLTPKASLVILTSDLPACLGR